MAFKQLWIKPLFASILLHGALFALIGLMPKNQDRSEIFEVSLAMDEPSFDLSGKGHRASGLDFPRPVGIKTRNKTPEGKRGELKQESMGRPTKKRVESFHPTPYNTAVSLNKTDKEAVMADTASAVITHGAGAREIDGGHPNSGSSGKGSVGNGHGNALQTGWGAGADGVEVGGPGGPRFVHREAPEYPLYARRRKKEGNVVLMVCITENGRLLGVEVVNASDSIFVAPSLEAVKRSTFSPATHNGVPVPTKAILPIRFVLDEQKLSSQ